MNLVCVCVTESASMACNRHLRTICGLGIGYDLNNLSMSHDNNVQLVSHMCLLFRLGVMDLAAYTSERAKFQPK